MVSVQYRAPPPYSQFLVTVASVHFALLILLHLAMSLPRRLRRNLSSSLPSHFRFSPYRDQHSPFFNPHPEEDDPSRCLAPAVNSASALTRLEVLKGWEVNFSVLSLYLASALACLYVIIVVPGTSLSWSTSRSIPPPSSFDHIIRIALETASILLPLYYFLNLILIPKRTDEQIWTSVLLTVGLLATNPLTRDDLTLVRPRFLVITDSIYTATIYLYLLLAVHSYRVLNPQQFNFFSFYLPKFAIALSYALFKLALGLHGNVSLGLIPFARILTWVRLFISQKSSLGVTFSILLTSSMDFAFAVYLVGQVSRTADFLVTVPYVEYRAKQLGFRCFVYQTLAFCVSIITLSILTIILLPSSYIIFLVHNPKHIAVLEPPVARLSLALIYFTWTLVLAYVNLPPTPLLHRALYNLTAKFLHRVRNSPITLWLGLADVVTTADAEDSGDENETSNPDLTNNRTPVAYAANPLRPSSIPMRYRHHELFDDIQSAVRPRYTRRSTPAAASTSWINSTTLPQPPKLHVPMVFGSSSERTYNVNSNSDERVNLPIRRRLRLRKNLFVMETQVLMVNIAYLAYIFGNPREEIPNWSSHVHEARPRDELIFQFHEDLTESHECGSLEVEETEHEWDDGTMFRVNPYTMAERHGYNVYKYIACESLNTHAIILVNETRVVVSFSGTRDRSNWKVNANINRVVLDDRLTRFEYDLSNSHGTIVDVPDAYHTLDVSLNDEGRHGIPLDKEQHVDDNFAWFSDVRFGTRSLSDGDVPTRRYTESSSPLVECRAKSYGALKPHLAFHTNTTQQSRRDDYLYASNRREFRNRRHLPSPAVGQQVSMMASTFAHELATFGKAKVHVGFLEAYMSVRKRVFGALIELYGGRVGKGPAASLPLFFTGHSLGGAMATFGCYEAARYYKRIGVAKRQDISCTTFGCPRVGNEAFKMRYERLVETHWRFEMAADPIPKVSTVILNYVPVGVQVLIDQSGMLLIDPSFIEVQWWGQLANPYVGYKLHIRASYCLALRTYCKLYRRGTDDLADHFWPFPLRVQTKGFFRQLQFEKPTSKELQHGTSSTQNRAIDETIWTP